MATQLQLQAPMADEMFAPMLERFSQECEAALKEGLWIPGIPQAEKDLTQWAGPTNRKQNYTPEELAKATLEKKIADEFEKVHTYALESANALHSMIIKQDIIDNLADKMKSEGKAGRRLAVVELSARLAPALTFPGSSSYLEGVFVPYSENARLLLGESKQKQYVSLETATHSAENIAKRLQTSYTLAETSAAPTDRVLKSRRDPEVFVCAITPAGVYTAHKQVKTHFRSHFDAVVRETMHGMLKHMYGAQ